MALNAPYMRSASSLSARRLRLRAISAIITRLTQTMVADQNIAAHSGAAGAR